MADHSASEEFECSAFSALNKAILYRVFVDIFSMGIIQWGFSFRPMKIVQCYYLFSSSVYEVKYMLKMKPMTQMPFKLTIKPTGKCSVLC
jgi:hypothetical protein